ncbi:hypothetical protein GCM10009826_12590 [Humibacillus xanthopallidus]
MIPFGAAALPIVGAAVGAVFSLFDVGALWIFLGTLALSTFFYAIAQALVFRDGPLERRFLWVSVSSLVILMLGYLVFLRVSDPEGTPPPSGHIVQPTPGAKVPASAPVFSGTVANMPPNSVLWIFIYDDTTDTYAPLEAARLSGHDEWRLSGEKLVTGGDAPGTEYEALLVLIDKASDEHIIARSLYYDLLVEVPPGLVESHTLDRVHFVLR